MLYKVKIMFPILLVFFNIESICEINNNSVIEIAEYADYQVINGEGSATKVVEAFDISSGESIKKENAYVVSTKTVSITLSDVKEELYIYFESIKFRCDFKRNPYFPNGEKYDSNIKFSYDGEEFNYFQITTSTMNKELPVADVKKLNKTSYELLYEPYYDPKYYGFFIKGTPISSFLRGNLRDDKIKNLYMAGEDTIDNIYCKIFKGQIASSGDTITVWLAQKYFYRPKYIEIKSNDKLTVIHNIFRNHMEDIWFPEKVVYETYSINNIYKKKLLLNRVILLIHADFKINTDLPADIFKIHYPKGSNVFDTRTNKSHLIK